MFFIPVCKKGKLFSNNSPSSHQFFLLYTIKKIINNFKMLPRNVISNKHFLTITSSVFVYRCVYIYCFSFAILPFCLSCIWISCNNITVVYPFVFPVFICYPQSILLLNVAFPFVNLWISIVSSLQDFANILDWRVHKLWIIDLKVLPVLDWEGGSFLRVLLLK